MSDPPKEAKPPLAKPKFAPNIVPGTMAAPAKKKAPSVSFVPTIPSATAKAAPGTGMGSAAGQAKPLNMRPTGVRPPAGAPPGMRHLGGARGPPGKGFGGKPGFAPRQPAWVPVGVSVGPSSAGGSGGSSAAMAPSSSATSGAPGATSDTQASAEPKRREKQYEQMDIAPTAQSMAIDPLNLNHPMTLPFLDPLKANPNLKLAAQDGGDVAALGSDLRASAITLDSTSVRTMGTAAEKSNPANLMFKNEDGEYLGEDQLFFIQMPSAIPLGDAPVRASVQSEMSQVLGFKGTLNSLPSGHIGKLLVFKSGKVKLKIGDVLFDVSTGMPCNFLQEVVSINMDRKKYYQLGDIARRMVCFPDIESLLADDHLPSATSQSKPESMDLT